MAAVVVVHGGGSSGAWRLETAEATNCWNWKILESRPALVGQPKPGPINFMTLLGWVKLAARGRGCDGLRLWAILLFLPSFTSKAIFICMYFLGPTNKCISLTATI
jgi:hypothetical protein